MIKIKKNKIENEDNCGTEMLTLSEDEKNKQSIKDEIILKLSDIAKIIEIHYNYIPQDIEFAIKDDKIFILQSRPITTLLPILQKIPDKLNISIKNLKTNNTENIEFDENNKFKSSIIFNNTTNNLFRFYFSFNHNQGIFKKNLFFILFI